MENNFSGIYAIVNTVNDHKYIGSAINIHNRWNDHKKNLRNNKHHSSHLQNTWNKYGESVFQFIVLQKVENKADLISTEQRYIDTFTPEYNVCKVAGSTLGQHATDKTRMAVAEVNRMRVCSEETRRKLATNKGKIFSPEHRKKMSIGRLQYYANGGTTTEEKQVDQFSLEGIFLTRYESIASAARAIGIPATHISRCARGKRKSTGGFVWSYT